MMNETRHFSLLYILVGFVENCKVSVVCTLHAYLLSL